MLRTERLLLRRWRDSDREPFAALNADPEVMEHFVRPLDRAGSDALVDRIEASFEEHGYGLWAVSPLDEPDALAGFTGLAVPNFDAHFTPAVEVGWRLARPYWGRGYATEAARAAAAYAFGEAGLTELVSFTPTTNLRSTAVMRRLGMTHDPADDFDHPNVPADHPLHRFVLYRLTADRWRHNAT
jgi:RimJ/RimL family protein N-acetyltransferase